MRRQDLILNLFLLLSLGVLGWKLHRDWKEYAMRNGPQALETRAITAVSVPALSATPDYTAVARQNPFQADRNDVIPEAAAQASGFPPKVLECSPGLITLAMLSVTAVKANGIPPAIPLDAVMISGVTPQFSEAQSFPVRPNPD